MCWPRENIGSVGGEGKTIGQKRPHIVCNEGTKCLQLDLYVFIGVALKVLPFFLFVCHVCWLVVTFLDSLGIWSSFASKNECVELVEVEFSKLLNTCVR